MISVKDTPELVESDLSVATAPSIPEPEPTVEPEPVPDPTVEPVVELEPEPDFELESEPEPEAAVLAVLEPVAGGTVGEPEPEVIREKKLEGAASFDPAPVLQSDSRGRCIMHTVIYSCINSGNRSLYSCVSANIKIVFCPK